MTRRSICGGRSRACPKSGSSASRHPTISGRWATPARAARARRFSTITATTSRAARPARRTRTATASSRSGISCSCSSRRCRAASGSTCRARRSTPAWGSSASPPCLQGVHDNYDIDLFRALIRASADLTGVDPDGPQRASHRVIADHLRASAFLVADGVLPSNEGRGYVLRRIMRRAMRHAQIAWRARSADVAARAGADARDGPGLSRADPRRVADLGDAEARGDALSLGARAGPRHSRGRDALAWATAAS